MARTILRSFFFLVVLAVIAPLSAQAECVVVDQDGAVVNNEDGSMTAVSVVTWNCSGQTHVVITTTTFGASGGITWTQGTYVPNNNGGLTPTGWGTGTGPSSPMRPPVGSEGDHECVSCG